jgi:hypothetical protein
MNAGHIINLFGTELFSLRTFSIYCITLVYHAKGDISDGLVTSLTSYFVVPKGSDDIHNV